MKNHKTRLHISSLTSLWLAGWGSVPCLWAHQQVVRGSWNWTRNFQIVLQSDWKSWKLIRNEKIWKGWEFKYLCSAGPQTHSCWCETRGSVAVTWHPGETCSFLLILAKQKQNDSVLMKHGLELQSYQIRNSLTSEATWSALMWLGFQTWMKIPSTNFQKILERLQHLPLLHQIKVSHGATSATYCVCFVPSVWVKCVDWMKPPLCHAAHAERLQTENSSGAKRSSWGNKFKSC